jgi:NADPH2:quinone reductase
MKAWLLDSPDGLSKLRMVDIPDPAPAPDQVVIRLQYAALNPADHFLALGQYPAKPAWPHILGRDGCGSIVEVGGGVKSFKTGDIVCLLRGPVGVEKPGTFAQKVAVAADSIAHVPDGWTTQQAAAAPLVYLTAYRALTDWGDLPPSVVLISGAAGGVGSAAVQLAKAIGHRIIGLSRNPRKRDELTKMGAEVALDPSDSHWPEQLKTHLKDQRVDLAVDNVGGTLFPQLIQTLGAHGKVSCVGRSAGVVPEFNTATLFFRQLRVGGVAVGAYTRPQAQAAWQSIVSLLQKTGDRPLIDSVHPFDHLPQAFDRLTHSPTGKVLLQIQ